MAVTQEPFLSLYWGWDFGDNNWKPGMDANIQRIGATVQIGVESKSQDVADIISPADGVRYLVKIGATGAWVGKDNQLAYYRSGVWYFIAPHFGWIARIKDLSGSFWGFDSTTGWTEFGAPVTGSGFADAPNDGKAYVRQSEGWVDARTIAPSVNTQTGTSYTILAADYMGIVRMNNAADNTITIPTNATTNFKIGTIINIVQAGAGQTTVAGDTGVTVNSPQTLKTRKQFSTVSITKVGTDEWDFSGDMVELA